MLYNDKSSAMSRISEITMERRCGHTEAKRLADCEAQGSLAASDGYARSKFEKWISAPPYERDIYRWPQDETKHSWPGQYKDIAVQLAWDAWNEAHNVKLCDPAP